jgi:hypothetical protein
MVKPKCAFSQAVHNLRNTGHVANPGITRRASCLQQQLKWAPPYFLCLADHPQFISVVTLCSARVVDPSVRLTEREISDVLRLASQSDTCSNQSALSTHAHTPRCYRCYQYDHGHCVCLVWATYQELNQLYPTTGTSGWSAAGTLCMGRKHSSPNMGC